MARLHASTKMDFPISTDPAAERKAARLSLIGLLPLAAGMALFALARHTVLVPPDRIAPILTRRTIVEAIVAALFVPGALAGLAICHRLLFGRIIWSSISTTLAPLYLLLLYPLRVFVLFPLRTPQALGVLMTPRPLLWLSFSLCAFEFMRSALLSTILERQLLSKVREKSPFFVAATLFVLTFIVFGVVTCHNNRGEMLVGDEPHYLFIMQSLKQFHTAELTQLLKVPEENLPKGITKVRPHKSRQSAAGSTYSIHNIGLPLLLVIPHSVAGLHGVMLFFGAVTALLVANIFLLGVEITQQKWFSALTAGLLGLSCPFAFYFRCIYPDVVAALFVVYAFRVVRKESPAIGAALLAGAAAAFLPWLHAKYVLFAATLFIGAVVALRRTPLKLLTFAVPFLVSAPLLIWFFYTAYGSWLPSAQYGSDSPPVSRFFWRGAPGAFFDRNHGILAFAPIYFLAAAGLTSMVREHRRDSVLIAILTLPSFVAFSSHWMWWGGPCPPGRFIMPLLPFAAPMIVLALTRMTNPTCRLTAAAAAAMGIGIFLLSVRFPDTLTTHKHIFSYCSTAWNAFPCLPNFFIHRRDPVPASSFALLACWLVPIAILIFHGLRRPNALERGGPPPHPPRVVRYLPVPLLAVSVAFPGLLARLSQALDEANPVDRFTHNVGEYAQPLLRSGINPGTYSLPADFGTDSVTVTPGKPVDLTPAPPDRVQGRSVTVDFMNVLYPVNYALDCWFQLRTRPTDDRTIGRVTLFTDRNKPIAQSNAVLWENQAAGHVRLTFCPDTILSETRISYSVNGVQSVEYRTSLTAYLGDSP